MQNKNLGAFSIYRALIDCYNNCSADEEIGMLSLLKYHHYLLRNNPQINLELENKQLRDKVGKLELLNDDLLEDLKTLKRLKK